MGSYFHAPEIKRITLTDPEYWIEIKTDLTYGDLKQIGAIGSGEDGNMTVAADKLLQLMVVGWNLTDESGAIVEILPENLDKLSQADAILVLNESGSLISTEEEKKSSSKE